MALLPLKLSKTSYGGAGEYDQVALTSGQSPIDGDLLVLTNNEVTVCGADPAVISYVTQTNGTAVVPGDTRLLMQRIKSTEAYEINAFHTTAANATVPNSAIDGQSDFGVIFNTVSGVAAWFVDLEDTSNDRVRLIERLDSATTQYPRCRVQFLAAVLTFN